MATLQASLDLTPADAAAFFAAKGNALSFDYTEVWREANVHAFTVAKATSADVLRVIREQVEEAIGPGLTFEQFKKNLRPQLERLGWWGQSEVLDGDTGEISKVQLGSTRRLRTIYQTNVQTAYMAGRYKRYLANIGERPYWRYVAVMDGRTRPAHAALNGKVYRWDDPIWQVIWPPNGWGCRCRVVALTQAEFEKLGVKLSEGKDAIREIEVPINKAGDTAKVKAVDYLDANGKKMTFRPDPGWDYNPGAEWARFDPAGFKGESIGVKPVTPKPAAGVIKAVDGLQTWADIGRPDLRSPEVPRLPQPQLLPIAPSRQDATAALVDVLLGAGRNERVVVTPVENVVIRGELLPHLVEKTENARERYANFIIPALEDPFEVWLTPYDDGTYRKRYISLFEGRNDLLMVVRENRDGSLLWELYNVLNANSKRLNTLRQGTLLYGKDVK